MALPPLKIRCLSEQSKRFREKELMPETEKIIEDIHKQSLSVLVWAPWKLRFGEGGTKKDAYLAAAKARLRWPFFIDPVLRKYVSRFRFVLDGSGLFVSTSMPLLTKENRNSKINELKIDSAKTDLVCVVLFEDEGLFGELFRIASNLSPRFLFFLEESIEQRFIESIRKQKNITDRFDFKNYFERNGIYRLEDAFTEKMQKEKKRTLIAKHLLVKKRVKEESPALVCHQYKDEIDLFSDEDYLFLLAFLRYLGNPTGEILSGHIDTSQGRLEDAVSELIRLGYLEKKA